MSIDNINEELQKVYEPYLEEFKKLTKNEQDKFSYPLFMKVFSDYENVKCKILFIGKETNTWYGTMENPNIRVEDLMNNYEKFQFAKKSKRRNSPIWSFIKNFHKKINGEDFSTGFLWTNFSKFDMNGTTPHSDIQQLNEEGFDLLLKEIEIIQPDIIIFFAGWKSYRNQFERVFDGVKYEIIEKDFLKSCKHLKLSQLSFMLPHPKYLRLRKKFNSAIELLFSESNKLVSI